jgi:molecular chaperone IbpA
MTKITSFDLAPFYRNTVGIDRLFDRITRQIDAAATGNYPPYDIVVTGDNTYEIRVAAAGFRLEEIEVEYHEGQLTVTGAHADAQINVEYLHHGISNRSWVRSWTLADYVEVRAAVMKDGILTIQLERIVPEAMKPRKIAISYDTNASV